MSQVGRNLNHIYDEMLDKFDEREVRKLSQTVQDNISQISYNQLDTEEILALAAYEIQYQNRIPSIRDLLEGKGEYVGSKFGEKGLLYFSRWSFGASMMQRQSAEVSHDIRGLEHRLERPPTTPELQEEGCPSSFNRMKEAGTPYRTVINGTNKITTDKESDIVEAVHSEDYLPGVEEESGSTTQEVVNTMLRGRYFEWMNHDNIPEGVALESNVDLKVFEGASGPKSLIDYYWR